jgi:hypothetical protein
MSIMRKLMLIVLSVCILLGWAAKAEVEGVKESNINDKNQDSDKYVKKVIIDAEWGDGPGEFGMDLSVLHGPINLVIDKENIYIYDCGNRRIHKYDSLGNLEKTFGINERDETGNPGEEEIVNFTVKDDTLYGILFPVWPHHDRIILINTNTGNKIAILKFNAPKSDIMFSIEKGNGELFIERNLEERYRLNISFDDEKDTFLVKTTGTPNFYENFSKLDKKKGELILGEKSFLILDVPGLYLGSAWQIARDKDGNFYIEVFSENPVGAPSPRTFYQVFKFSNKGKKLATVDIPLGSISGASPKISENGDIYCLYATGEVIEKDWKISFFPGKVQLIKWELQK